MPNPTNAQYAMTGHPPKTPLYPAYTFRASPTYFAWVRLPATDIHTLRREPGFEGQNIYFYLNHPIRFICITAPVVAIEDLFSRFVLLTLDDGSGATVAVKIERKTKERPVGEWGGVAREALPETVVEGVRVKAGRGAFEVFVEGVRVDIGTVLKVKGVVETWRDQRQMLAKRIVLARGMTEVLEWEELARWRGIVGQPWVLSQERVRELDAEERRWIEEKRRKREEKRAMQEKHERKRRKLERNV
ncbi:hypothetical protein EJ06DRAFT_509826 [Trichodelitschia bisporula]|uniref:CST complex subunit Stn1 N-terminal domain-containing protein n=1 Tax=Trichodelitschia bisporula TaxID=703511 RepID=A0A6G1HYC3_9PEZI|nr:hypothetical protein EJ06DRAFT_509826 [Trichodelitschia bisporula]